jgi:Flp pilus assembly protein TadB
MNSASIPASRSLLAAIAALAGVLFFFVIVGVFGLPASIAALVIFVALSLTIFRRPQYEEMQR